MSTLVHCIKKNKELPGLAAKPVPGELGDKILANVSKEAWQEWVKHQTILINENKLSLVDSAAQEFLMNELEKYFFKGGSEKPEEYIPTD